MCSIYGIARGDGVLMSPNYSQSRLIAVPVEMQAHIKKLILARRNRQPCNAMSDQSSSTHARPIPTFVRPLPRQVRKHPYANAPTLNVVDAHAGLWMALELQPFPVDWAVHIPPGPVAPPKNGVVTDALWASHWLNVEAARTEAAFREWMSSLSTPMTRSSSVAYPFRDPIALPLAPKRDPIALPLAPPKRDPVALPLPAPPKRTSIQSGAAPRLRPAGSYPPPLLLRARHLPPTHVPPRTRPLPLPPVGPTVEGRAFSLASLTAPARVTEYSLEGTVPLAPTRPPPPADPTQSLPLPPADPVPLPLPPALTAPVPKSPVQPLRAPLSPSATPRLGEQSTGSRPGGDPHLLPANQIRPLPQPPSLQVAQRRPYPTPPASTPTPMAQPAAGSQSRRHTVPFPPLPQLPAGLQVQQSRRHPDPPLRLPLPQLPAGSQVQQSRPLPTPPASIPLPQPQAGSSRAARACRRRTPPASTSRAMAIQHRSVPSSSTSRERLPHHESDERAGINSPRPRAEIDPASRQVIDDFIIGVLRHLAPENLRRPP